MDFHPDKCSVLSITRSRKSTPDRYTLLEQTLQSVTSAKYLGAALQYDAKWDQHFNNIIAKASFPPPKSEDLCHQYQTTGIQVTCEASPGVCQHRLGSSHKEGHLKD